MTKLTTLTSHIRKDSQTQKVVFRILVGLIAVLCIVYLYLISSITFNIVARKSLETTIRGIGSTISDLELSYIARANMIDKSYALSLGFVETKHNMFAQRDTSRVAVR